MKKRRRSSTITLKGAAANGFIACMSVDHYGAKAHHNCTPGGPAEIAILERMKYMGITPEPRPEEPTTTETK